VRCADPCGDFSTVGDSATLRTPLFALKERSTEFNETDCGRVLSYSEFGLQ